MRHLQRVLVCSRVSDTFGFVFVPNGIIPSEQLVVFTTDKFASFAILQSRAHELWARFMASSMKDDLRYNPSDCFETFPFPEVFESNLELEKIGAAYYGFRADMMIRNNEGLTKTYNRFHNPNDHAGDIKKLRELHDAIDRVVLDAYGWPDIHPASEFFREFAEDEVSEEESMRTRSKKYRYRWPDEIHDEVLARLLSLNQQRAAVPQIEAAPPVTRKQPSPKIKKSKKSDDSNPSLFEPQMTQTK